MSNEFGELSVNEFAVLEKFDGEVEDGVLVERIELLNGKITKHEWLEDGRVTRTETFKD
jgi:hypothetical protein